MPLYRYQCDNCGHVFTVLESVRSNSLRVCERCGARAARRVLSRVGVLYKGAGFYSTDYRRHGKRDHQGAEEKEKDGGKEPLPKERPRP
jgi:putative FmdB family regulatory protein